MDISEDIKNIIVEFVTMYYCKCGEDTIRGDFERFLNLKEKSKNELQ